MNSEKIAMRIEDILNNLYSRLRQKIVKSDIEGKPLSYLYRLMADINDTLNKVKKEGSKIEEFVKIVRVTRSMPEDVINLLSLTELPVIISGGRIIVEGIVGYRGLGIETIDHHLNVVDYENVKKPEKEALTDISITSLMYRVPPFELTRCSYEEKRDEEITRVLGARHIWLVKPRGVIEQSWNKLLKKVVGKRTNVIIANYNRLGKILQLNTLKLIDLTKRSLELEIADSSTKGKYFFYLKFGSSRIEETLANIKTKEKILKALREMEGNIRKEIGYRGAWRVRLDYIYFCYKGLAISTDPYDIVCPFKNCPLRISGMCNGEKFWSAKYYKRKPYPKIYPLRTVNPGFGGMPSYQEILPAGLISFKAYDKRRIESSWYGIEMGTWFIRARPTIRIYFDEYSKIGYSIPTSLLELSFNMEWLNELIKSILLENDEVRRNVAFKYVLINSLGKRLDYIRLTKALTNIISNKGKEAKKFVKYYKEKNIDDDIIKFARRILLHSLTHLLTQYILFRLVGVDYNFVLTRYYYNKVAKIFIIENAKNGRLGIVDTVAKNIKRKGLAVFLLEITEWLDSLISMHDIDFKKISMQRKNEAKKLITTAVKKFASTSSQKADRLLKVDNIVKNFRDELRRADLNLDLALVRTVLLLSNRISENLIQDIEDYFDDILEKNDFQLCWDGCNACVRLEKHCNEGIFQILTTSKTLLHAFIKHLHHLLSTGINHTSRNVGKILEPLIKNAEKTLEISSPFISPRYASILVNKSNKGVKVRVLTSIPEGEEGGKFKYHFDALAILKKNLSERLEVRSALNLHAKMYIIDDKILATGSANLTESGLYKNLEHIEIKMLPKIINDNKREFEDLWIRAKPI